MKDKYITEITLNPYEGYFGTKNVHEETKMKKPTEQTKENKPEQKFRAGSVTATIWGKEIKIDGRKDPVTVYNTEFSKNYKDGEDWKKTNNYNRDDLVKLQVVLAKTLEFLYLNEEEDK